MISKVFTAALNGIDAELIIVETDVSAGLPALNVVGLPGIEIREARERMRVAVHNMGVSFPARRVTVNLSPADTRKEGSHFDLPMAVGILGAMSLVPQQSLENTAFLGELSLDGSLKAIRGVLPLAEGILRNGIKNIVIPAENLREASLVEGVNLIPAGSLAEVSEVLRNPDFALELLERYSTKNSRKPKTPEKAFEKDFADVYGQENAKRALVIAAAGMHNIAMVGFPGSGKTMLASRLPGILPEMTYEEKLEVTKIYSIAGEISPDEPLMDKRPFRCPHHTISAAGLVGGGSRPRPGEISLSHNGVLFLDEFPEFTPSNLEMLRQPLESGEISICRAAGNYRFPADFMLVIAANPCRCGYYGDPMHNCTCTPSQIAGYRRHFSGPLLDRIDIQLEVMPVKYEELSCEAGISPDSGTMRASVSAARQVQEERFRGSGIKFNSSLAGSLLKKYCTPSPDGERLLEEAFRTLALSARARDRILRVSRTIADIEGDGQIGSAHIAEALSYRSLDKLYRG
ncbi:MAG: YifB family Mg chelatase-like AAA ATPase [Clostridia bacterium]|nr:YifB family Mg chelatase-like AAA ATPase [Clostridia bacterium]